MDLLALTGERYVWSGLTAPDKEKAIELVLDLLHGEGGIPPDARDEVLAAVLERERRLSTGLERGIAIPHGTTNRVQQEVAGIGVFPGGVPFEAVDDEDTKIVILLITPQRERYRHVTILASIARLLLSPAVRGALLEARSREDLVSALRMLN